MVRKIALLLVLALLALTVGACKKDDPVPEPVETDGFIGMDRSKNGGSAIDGANIKELSISGDSVLSSVTIDFLLGSKISSVDEAAIDAVPSYNVSFTGFPLRLVLEFDDIDFWDYTRTFEMSGNPLIHGVFRQTFSSNNRFQLIFPLKTGIDYMLEERGGTLTLSMRQSETLSAPPELAYYITSNATDFYSEGIIPESTTLAPILCGDLQNVLLISAPFETQDAATAAANALYDRIPLLSDGQLSVISLAAWLLPAYNSSLDYVHVLSKPIVRRGGRELTMPAIIPSGIYLATAPDGRILYSKQLPDEPATGDDVLDTEELWLIDTSGRSKQLTEIEFGVIEKAEFSPDGKRLALLELAGESSYLHIYDMEANRLSYNLAEEGLGSSTRTFIWDAMGTAIFAISGTSKLYLQKYDFTIPDETARISAVEEQEASEGELGFHNGEVYFANVSSEGREVIYRIKPEGGLRAEFTTGTGFRISPDGLYMAVYEAGSSGGEEDDTVNISHIKLKDMNSGDESYVVQNTAIVSYGWSGGTLYYATAIDPDASLSYPYKLWSFVPGSQPVEMLDMVAFNFNAPPQAGLLYLNYINADEYPSIRATYLLDLHELERQSAMPSPSGSTPTASVAETDSVAEE